MSTQVRYFDSTMSGAPTLSGTAGTLISVLDACLVNGFGSVVVNTLTVASNVATATVSTGHNFPLVGSTGAVIRIEGATPSGLNGDFRIQSATTTTFTFTTSGITDQTATGTISAKRAPAGFSKAFSGTNKAVYRADDIQSTRMYLRVEDSATTYAAVSGYETMSDVDTGGGPFNGGGTGRWSKSDVANTSARSWRLFSDGHCFYLFVNKGAVQSNYYTASFWFGDMIPNIPDAFRCGIIATDPNHYDWGLALLGVATYSQFARSYTGLGSVVAFARYSSQLSDMGFSGMAYPSPIGNEVIVFPVLCTEGGNYRGDMPGLYGPAHKLRNITNDGLVISDMQTNDGMRDMVVQAVREYNGYRALIDITGPWR